jgi:DNA helicase HerA-like ATPase
MQATLHMLRNVTRRGRKRWLAMAFVSQQPGHLPPEIFELCNTRIVHTLRSMHNLDALMGTTGEVSREVWARCPLLGQGQAVLSSPQLNRSVTVSVRPAASRRKCVQLKPHYRAEVRAGLRRATPCRTCSALSTTAWLSQ